MPYFGFLKNIFFKDFIYLILERGEGKEKGRETSMCGCLLRAPYWGPGLHPRHVPWLGIEPVTLWFAGQCSIHWATPVRAIFGIKKKIIFIVPKRGRGKSLSVWGGAKRSCCWQWVQTTTPQSVKCLPCLGRHWQHWSAVSEEEGTVMVSRLEATFVTPEAEEIGLLAWKREDSRGQDVYV